VSGCGDEAPVTPSGAPAAGSAVVSAAAAGGDQAQSGGAAGEAKRCPEPRVPLARRLEGKLAEVCERSAVDPMAPEPKLDVSLTGAWRGEYVDESPGSSPTRFDASLIVTGGVVSGTTTEPNTFGTFGYSELEALLNGDAYATRQVVWLKTYRTGATNHSVLYVGRLDEAGRRIEGHWRVSGGTRGTFWMERS
jgi:hypothetical protein